MEDTRTVAATAGAARRRARLALELIAGLDTRLFVTASLVGFVVCQVLFGLLLYVRRHN
jgi:hypothetical protein